MGYRWVLEFFIHYCSSKALIVLAPTKNGTHSYIEKFVVT